MELKSTPYKPFLLIVIVVFFSNLLKAQDIIFFKDGTKDSVKILEITTKSISYKKFKRLKGPVYTVKKEKVLLIEFEDGEIEVITNQTGRIDTFNTEILKKRNIISTNVLGMALGNIHLGYERINKDGKESFKANFTYNVLPELITPFYVLGLDYNFYVGGQKKKSFFLGPSVRAGVVGNNVPFVAAVINLGFSKTTTNWYTYSFHGGTGIMGADGFIPYLYIMLSIGNRF